MVDFSALPPEIRIEVYHYYMHGPRAPQDPHSLNIVHICRLMRHEYIAEAVQAMNKARKSIQDRPRHQCSVTISLTANVATLTYPEWTITLPSRPPNMYLYSPERLESYVRKFLDAQLSCVQDVQMSLQWNPDPQYTTSDFILGVARRRVMKTAIKAVCAAIDSHIDHLAASFVRSCNDSLTDARGLTGARISWPNGYYTASDWQKHADESGWIHKHTPTTAAAMAIGEESGAKDAEERLVRWKFLAKTQDQTTVKIKWDE